MHTHHSLLPSVSSRSSLDSTTVSSISIQPTANDLDEKDKQRLVKQTRKLSQILGELPPEVTARPHTAGSSAQTAEAPSTGLSQQYQQRVRFSIQRYSFIDPPSRSFRSPLQPSSEGTSEMSPPLLPPARDGPPVPVGRSSTPTRRRPSTRLSHTGQLDLTLFGLGRLRAAGSTRSDQSDENARPGGLLSNVAEMPTRSASLRVSNQVHQARGGDKPRRRSVQDPSSLIASQTTSQKSTGNSSSTTHPRRLGRSVSLWAKGKTTGDDSAHHQHPTTGQIREEDDWDDEQPPLTEAQRIQSLRRGKKLTQVFGRSQLDLSGQLIVALQLFGTKPPIALYRTVSPFEDEPTSHNTVTEERIKTYLALSSGDSPSPVPSCRSSIQFSRSNLSSISIVVPSSDAPAHGVEIPKDPKSDKSPAIPLIKSDDDLDSIAQLPCDHSDEKSAMASFRRRRLRAAKLSRFFGVAYNDLSIPMATATRERQTSGEGVSPAAEVDVKIQERGRFWNRAEGGYKDCTERADMNDAIALLRQMPRS